MTDKEALDLERRIVKETAREFKTITDPEKISYLLEKYTAGRELTVKNQYPLLKARVKPKGGTSAEVIFAYNFNKTDSFILFATFNKQIEFLFTGEQKTPDTVDAQVKEVRIASEERLEKRLMLDGEQVYASDFLIAMAESAGTSAISSKVVFKEFEARLAEKFDWVSIISTREKNDDPIIKLITEEKKGVIITDLNDEKSYEALSDEVIDMTAHKKREKFENAIFKMKNAGAVSVIYYPVFNVMARQKAMVAVINIRSNGEPFSPTTYLGLEKTAEQIQNKLIEANTLSIPVKQRVINISSGGAQIEVTDDKLKKEITRLDHMTLNIVFKLQSKLRFHAEIKHIQHIPQKDMYLVGVAFTGEVTEKSQHKGSQKEMLVENINYMGKTDGKFV